MRLGCAHEIELDEARKLARKVAGDKESAVAEREGKRTERSSMPLGEPLDAHVEHRSQVRVTSGAVKTPKTSTLKDIRSAFSPRAILELRDRAVATLRVVDLEAARNEVHP